jgi:TonB family protein
MPATSSAQTQGARLTVWWGGTLLDSAHLAELGQIEATRPGGLGRGVATPLGVAPAVPEGFVLLEKHAHDVTVHAPPGAQATLHAPGAAPRPLPDAAWSLQPGESVHVALGGLTLVAEGAESAPPVARRARADWGFVRVAVVAGLTHAFLVAAALMTPPAYAAPQDLLRPGIGTFDTTLLIQEKPKPRPRGEPKPQVARAPGPRRPGPAAAPKAPGRRKAQDVGLLAVLRTSGPGVDRVLGSTDVSVALNQAMTGLRGPGELADHGGAGGLGTRGIGGGGEGGSVGIGGLGTHGGGGDGPVALGGRRPKGPTVLPGRTVTIGALGKEDVGRVMRRHAPRFRHCYERELSRDPNLAGKVVLHFTIAPTGQVTNAKVTESTVGDVALERCLTEVMRSVPFPSPKGGGVVMVTYPFLFAQTGG